MDVTKFRERPHRLTALLVEFEARLTVGEITELTWRLPFELADAAAVLLKCKEPFQVIEQLCYDEFNWITILV